MSPWEYLHSYLHAPGFVPSAVLLCVFYVFCAACTTPLRDTCGIIG